MKTKIHIRICFITVLVYYEKYFKVLSNVPQKLANLVLWFKNVSAYIFETDIIVTAYIQ